MTMLSNLTNSFLNLLFPRRCYCCGERISQGEQSICAHCLIEMPRTNYHLYPANEMEQRFWGKIEIERSTALFHFEKHEGYRQVIHELKYKNAPQLGLFLGMMAAHEAQKGEFFDGIDSIVPVPLHWKRQWQRGYNQSEMIGRGISAVTSIPISKHLIKRIRNNQSQTKHHGIDRWENVKSIFKLQNKANIEGKHLLLVDDVCTSGSTLESLAKELQKTARVKISILTLAVARFQLPKDSSSYR